MTEGLEKKLNDCTSKGYVIAPAGYGKTHLIALSVKESASRQLILTHTFAGVNSIKKKLAALNVPSSKYQVDTIASWALRICLSYPQNSGWKTENPTNKQWNKLYECCAFLLRKRFICKAVLATYSGVYVDEYQDCSELQHSLVCSLAEIMPCRILGDPMQSIFDFDGEPVDWDEKIYPYFSCLGQLDTPWRWKQMGDSQLGEWLKGIRDNLDQGLKVDLCENRPESVSVNFIYSYDRNRINIERKNSLLKLLSNNDTVIALFGGDPASKNKAHKLANGLGGRFSSIEEVEGKDLHSFIKKIDAELSSQEKLLLGIGFSEKCFTSVKKVLTAPTKRGEFSKPQRKTKYPSLRNSANEYLNAPTSRNLKGFLMEINVNPETSIYRRDLFNRLLNVLAMHIDGRSDSLLDAANLYQTEMRHSGRPVRHQKLIGTTLLVKGLEYDHAVILNADELNAKDLYVAMTRGSKSLTIISSSRYLPVK